MRTRERRVEQIDLATPRPDEVNAARLDDLRETGNAFLAAADEAIERALSADSEAFLAQNRQMGGQ